MRSFKPTLKGVLDFGPDLASSWKDGEDGHHHHEDDGLGLTEEDLLASSLMGHKGPPLLLGVYSKEFVMETFEQFGITPRLHGAGFDHLEFQLDTSDPFVHHLLVTDERLKHNPTPTDRHLLSLFVRRQQMRVCDFVARPSSPPPQVGGGGEGEQAESKGEVKQLYVRETCRECSEWMEGRLKEVELKISVIEWLSMQNPVQEFREERPRLPGQDHPGLGVARPFLDMLLHLAQKQGRDGLLNKPQYYHNAYLYANKGFLFVSPQDEAFYRTITMDLQQELEDKGLAAVSWAIFGDCLRCTTSGNAIVRWEKLPQMRSMSATMSSYFEDETYEQLVQKCMRPGSFHIDWTAPGATYALSFRVAPAIHKTTGENEEENKQQERRWKQEQQ
ncbi:Protein kinase domain-containing protein [Balamuthia mandrillaris]